jgi:hypothetical protein
MINTYLQGFCLVSKIILRLNERRMEYENSWLNGAGTGNKQKRMSYCKISMLNNGFTHDIDKILRKSFYRKYIYTRTYFLTPPYFYYVWPLGLYSISMNRIIILLLRRRFYTFWRNSINPDIIYLFYTININKNKWLNETIEYDVRRSW